MGKRKSLTKRRLEAIVEALHARLAGATEGGELQRADYEAALEWAERKLAARSGGTL